MICTHCKNAASGEGDLTEFYSELFFPDSRTLSKIVTGGEVPSARSSATMARVGSKLYVFGGLSRDSGWLNDLHAFDTGM